MRAAVHHRHGIIHRELGDGLFAVFGAPIADDLHAVMACLAALDLLRRCERKNDPREYANAILRGDARADDVLAETERLYRDLGVS